MNTSAVAQMIAVGNASLQLTLLTADGARLNVSPQQAAIDALQHGAANGAAELPSNLAASVDLTV
jgi:hypothetical protein